MYKKLILYVLLLSQTVTGPAQENRISVHDPVMFRCEDKWYLFATGMGISVWSSSDMKSWKPEKPVFMKTPQWAIEAVPSFKGHIWAPDISFHNGLYYLYYSVSAFGKNTSCIGLATNRTLNPENPDFKWTDHGKVIQSFPGKTNWNAIDPNLATDKKGASWLVFGSFWDGLQIIRLTDDLASPADDKGPVTLASRNPEPDMANPPAIDNNPADAGGNAIEAPFIFSKGKYFYLFASIDYCCKGVNSTYKMIVGRSKNIQGPYLDKEGKSMRTGGGTILMSGDKDWNGLGHNAVLRSGKDDYLVFHAYDAADKGRSKLRIYKLKWNNGWPEPSVPVY